MKILGFALRIVVEDLYGRNFQVAVNEVGTKSLELGKGFRPDWEYNPIVNVSVKRSER